MNTIKSIFSALYALVKEQPLAGILLMLLFAASVSLLLYDVGKDLGGLIYRMVHAGQERVNG